MNCMTCIKLQTLPSLKRTAKIYTSLTNTVCLTATESLKSKLMKLIKLISAPRNSSIFPKLISYMNASKTKAWNMTQSSVSFIQKRPCMLERALQCSCSLMKTYQKHPFLTAIKTICPKHRQWMPEAVLGN
jgi:hypothetical protein